MKPGPVVIKLGGLAVEDPGRATPLLRAVIDLHRAEPAGVIIVHGGGRAVDEHLARLGLVPRREAGLRVTPESEINEVVAVLAGSVNKSIVGAVQSLGAPAVGLCLGDGLTARARPLTVRGVDLGRVGEIDGGSPSLLRLLLAERYIPVISPIALDEGGRPLNVNGDDAAAAIAAIVGARLLVLLTNVPGVLDASGRTAPELGAPAIEALIGSGVVHGGMIPKVRAAVRAATIARAPALIASWDAPADLQRLARGERVGTRVLPDGLEPASSGGIA
ncbi:MAG TPA: acetylglutamate kinase [Phycisphaerales bacterium]|nr:acetylglutamate kinase [Phycisphaerales bacterium]